MGLDISKTLTQQFYTWEQRGRGWHAFENPVDLEPAFHPFFGHYIAAHSAEDDSKHPTLFSKITDLIRGTKEHYVNKPQFPETPPVEGYISDCDERVSCLRVILPKDQKIQIEDMQQLLLMLSYTAYPVSFEIVGTSSTITIQFACRPSDESHVHGQIKAYFPFAVITKHEEGLDVLAPQTDTCAIDFGLSEEFMRPLRTPDETDQDPFIGLFATLENLQKGERGVIQILFKGTINPWAESIMRSVTDGGGGSFFADAPEMVKLAERKVSAPLYGVCARVAGQSATGRAIENRQILARRSFVLRVPQVIRCKCFPKKLTR